MDSQFAKGLGEWLALVSNLNVRIARENDRPEPGTVLLSGTDNHLIFSGPSWVGYTPYPLDCSYRPSIDVFFKSVAEHWTGGVIPVLLTGMGRDGAEGLRLLRDRGHHTITQDRSSSAVYGMPKAAAELNAASEILPLEQIGPRLVQLVSTKITAHG